MLLPFCRTLTPLVVRLGALTTRSGRMSRLTSNCPGPSSPLAIRSLQVPIAQLSSSRVRCCRKDSGHAAKNEEKDDENHGGGTSGKEGNPEEGGNKGNPGRGERPGGRDKNWPAIIGSVTAVGLLLVGVGGFWIQLQDFVENQSISHHTRKAVRAVCKSRCEKRDTDNYVDRVELRNRLKMTLLRKSDHDQSHKVKKTESRYVSTVIVCGPRGCGKSTLVAEIFWEEPAVINLSYNGISEDDFANAIFSSLQVKCPGGIKPSNFLEIVLKAVRDKGHKLPTLVIEVDKRFDGGHLEQLLLICKHLGDDLKLVTPVVVLSSSRAAFGMELCANVLRAKYVEVDDLSKDEARTFLFKALKTVNATDDKKKDAVEFAISAIGTRLVHLCEVAMVTSQCKSLNNFILEVKEYRQQSQKMYNIAFNKFVRTFPTFKKKEVLYMLTHGCELQDLCEMMKTTEDELIKHNGLIEPHLLYVSPRLYRVCVGSHFVKEIIKKQ